MALRLDVPQGTRVPNTSPGYGCCSPATQLEVQRRVKAPQLPAAWGRPGADAAEQPIRLPSVEIIKTIARQLGPRTYAGTLSATRRLLAGGPAGDPEGAHRTRALFARGEGAYRHGRTPSIDTAPRRLPRRGALFWRDRREIQDNHTAGRKGEIAPKVPQLSRKPGHPGTTIGASEEVARLLHNSVEKFMRLAVFFVRMRRSASSDRPSGTAADYQGCAAATGQRLLLCRLCRRS